MMTLKESDETKYVNFIKIPKTSFMTIKSRNETGKYYENLLQVVVKNQTYIYDLDDASGNPSEIDFIHGMDQLTVPEDFVNSGATASVI